MAKSTVELEGQTFFKHGSSVLIPSAKQRLRQISNEIRKHGYKGNIRITGNTCGIPDPRKDQALSEQRAYAVKNFMISQGFNPQHLDARGIGGAKPKFSKANEDFKNRRVDIEYMTERQQKVGGGFRNKTKRVQNGFKNVIAGYKRVQVGTKNVEVGVRNVQTGTTDIQVSQGAPGAPRVIWRTEPVNTAPAWVTRGLRNNLTHNRTVDTYMTTAGASLSTGGGNNGPVANNDMTTIEFNQTVDINVLNNDTDTDGDMLKITNVTAGSQGGNIRIEGNQIRYTPVAGFVGTETFNYTITDGSRSSTAQVSVTVNGSGTGGNTGPVATNDNATIDLNQTVDINVLNNDSDVDGDSLKITSVSGGSAGGSISVVNNQIRYTPKKDFEGVERFTYIITDGSKSATATVTITVKGSAVPTGECNTECTIANMDDVLIDKGSMATIDVLANDTGSGLQIVEVSQGQHGSVKISGNKVTYTPKANFVGNDVFWYAIKDASGAYKTSNKVMVYVDDAK